MMDENVRSLIRPDMESIELSLNELIKAQKAEDEIPDPEGYNNKIIRLTRLWFAQSMKGTKDRLENREIPEEFDSEAEGLASIEESLWRMCQRLGYDKFDDDAEQDLSWPAKGGMGKALEDNSFRIFSICYGGELRIEEICDEDRLEIVFWAIGLLKRIEKELPHTRKTEKIGWFYEFKWASEPKYQPVDRAYSALEGIVIFHSVRMSIVKRHLWFTLKNWLKWKIRRIKQRFD